MRSHLQKYLIKQKKLKEKSNKLKNSKEDEIKDNKESEKELEEKEEKEEKEIKLNEEEAHGRGLLCRGRDPAVFFQCLFRPEIFPGSFGCHGHHLQGQCRGKRGRKSTDCLRRRRPSRRLGGALRREGDPFSLSPC